MQRLLTILFLACAISIAAAPGMRAAIPVYPDSDTSYNPRVPCIAPVDKAGGGKCMEAEAVFRYELAPCVQFPAAGELQAEVRDNGRREAKEIVALADGDARLIVRVGKASDGRQPALVWAQKGKDVATAPLPQPLSRDWTRIDLKWDKSGASITLADGETARLTLPAAFAPQNISLQTAQVAGLKIEGDGTFSLDWTQGYAAQVEPSATGSATEARLFGFDTFVISRDESKRDCPMVQVINAGPEARSMVLECDLAGEVGASHQQWKQEIQVPAKSAVMTAVAFPVALTSDVYHLTVHSSSIQPALEVRRHFLFVEERDEPAGPAKFGLHDAARNLFGCWPDALPITLSTNYLGWGSVMGPPWLKDPGITADTPSDEWNWNRRVDWAIAQGLTTYVSLQSEPDYDWARERDYPADHMRKLSFGTLGGFPKLDLYRKFVRAVATRYQGKVHMYEVENEPMAHAGIPPEDYVKIAQAVFEEVHAVDPDAKVYGICGTGDFIPWMKKVFDLGGAKMMDGVSVHTYVTPNMPENAGLPGKLAEADKIIAGAGKPMPMLNSETGTYIALREQVDRPISPERLAELVKAGTPSLAVKSGWPFHAIDERSGGVSIVRNAVYNFLAGAQYFTFFGYNPAWPPANWATGGSLFSGEQHVDDACWAMISASKDGERTPSLFTLSAGVLTGQLKGADTLHGKPVDGEGLLGGVFPESNGGEVAVLWSPMGERSVLLEATDPSIETVSMLGQKTTLTAAKDAAGSRFRLELGEEPVYIHAAHPGLHILPSPVIALAQDISGERSGFHFTVVNTSSQPWQGSVALAAPAGWKATLDSQDFSLAPGQRVVVKGGCEMPGSIHKGSFTVEASMKLPDGSPFSFPIPVDVRPAVTITNVAPSFAWDQTASWSDVKPSLKIDQPEQVMVGRAPPLASLQEEKYWAGPKELSAEVRMVSAPDDLLVYMEVTDANLKLPPTWPSVDASCIELFLDGRSPESGLGSPAYAAGVHQLLIRPAEGARQALPIADASERFGKLQDVTAVGARTSDASYWIAVKIPWKSLNPLRVKDQPVGFDLAVDGSRKDVAKRKSQLMLFGTASNNTDASNFGIVRMGIDTANLGAR